jgi:D-alanyl-D-alanine carboxypeptidase-like protein
MPRQEQFAEMVGKLIPFATALGLGLRFGDALRSTDPLAYPGCDALVTYQELLFANGRTKIANPKNDRHSDRLAVDFEIRKVDGTPMTKELYEKLGVFWESLGGKWGGRWKEPHDPGHFELSLLPKKVETKEVNV